MAKTSLKNLGKGVSKTAKGLGKTVGAAATGRWSDADKAARETGVGINEVNSQYLQAFGGGLADNLNISKDGIGKKKNVGSIENGSAEQSLADYQAAIDDFIKNGNQQYSSAGDLGPSSYDDIKVDPRYADNEMAALRDLEQISKDGLSVRDQAELARMDGQVNRQNAGRQGAIQQNMAARGMGGSGMELVQQMQASQDATERQALASMEKAGMAQDGRRTATAQLGQLSGQLSARDYQQQAQKAAAQDSINKFNIANQQDVRNRNTQSYNQHQGNVLTAKQGGSQMNYNAGADQANRNIAKTAGKANPLQGAMAGAGAGAAAGPWGAAGGAVLGAASTYMNQGGVVPGKANVPGDHPANDTVPAMLSPGEVVIPRTAVQEASKDHGSDAIDSLLKAMASMQKKGKQ